MRHKKQNGFINISLDFKAVALKKTISLEPANFYFCCSSVAGLLARSYCFLLYFAFLRIPLTALDKISLQEFFFYSRSPVQG
jgi:hypothetical protein